MYFFYKASALGSVASSAMAKGNYYCFIFQNQENFPDSTMGFNKEKKQAQDSESVTSKVGFLIL